MLFQIQKNLFTEAVKVPSGGLVKTTSPSDPAQYLVVKTVGKALEIIVSSQEVTCKTTIDGAGDALKPEQDSTYAVKGETLEKVLTRTIVHDLINVEFEKSASTETIKTANPADTPMQLLGNLILRWKNQISEEEVWSIPCVDTNSIDVPSNPSFDLSGKDRFKVTGLEFNNFIHQIGIAVGKEGGNAIYRNVLIRASQSRFEIVGSRVDQLAWAQAAPVEAPASDFSFSIPYSHMLTASKMLSDEKDIEIIYNAGSPGTVILSQDVEFGGKVVGKSMIRMTCATEKFVNFEKAISKLDFPWVCKFKTQQIKSICNRLEILQLLRTHVVLDVKKKALIFSKKEAGRGVGKGMALPLTFLNPEATDFEIDVSSQHVTYAVSNADADEVEWRFSGKKSLCCMILSEDPSKLKTFFSPLDDNE